MPLTLLFNLDSFLDALHRALTVSLFKCLVTFLLYLTHRGNLFIQASCLLYLLLHTHLFLIEQLDTALKLLEVSKTALLSLF